MQRKKIINTNDPILVTGASGFIGLRVVENLLDRGFKQVRCFVRPTSDEKRFSFLSNRISQFELYKGDLLSQDDCLRATRGVKVIYHLAAGTGTKSFADAFLNTVVTTRNLLQAAVKNGCLVRFVNMSSFAVYTNIDTPRRRILDESCKVEQHPERRAEAYCFAKVKQDELVEFYGEKDNLPFVHLRPGVVYGPGKASISGRIGIDTFGVFMHLGGNNPIPFTYVDNCAEAVVLAGLVKDIDGETINIVDDNIPTSRQFLRQYKMNVKKFRSIYIPKFLSYFFCCVWECYSKWSEYQLPNTFSRAEWTAYWKKTKYDNSILKMKLGWEQLVPSEESMKRYFYFCRERKTSA